MVSKWEPETGNGILEYDDKTVKLDIYFKRASMDFAYIRMSTDGEKGALTIGTRNIGDPSLSYDRMWINENGNVGIGWAKPGAKLSINGGLHVGGDSDPLDDNLWVDGNVGIGTKPLNKLDVGGGAAIGTGYSGAKNAPTDGLLVKGSVGIGTADPKHKLTVDADATGDWASDDGSAQLVLRGKTDNTLRLGIGVDTTNEKARIQAAKAGDTNSAIDLLLQPAGGNVGIGTLTPGAKLSINGGLHVGGELDPSNYNLLVDGKVTANQGFFGNSEGTINPILEAIGYPDTEIETTYVRSPSNVGKICFQSNCKQTALAIDTSSGNVGIGTDNLSARLCVKTTPFEVKGVSIKKDDPNVTGYGTSFNTMIAVGDQITIHGETKNVFSIEGETSLTADSKFSNYTIPGFTETMTVLPNIFRADDFSGITKFIISRDGRVGISGNVDVDGAIRANRYSGVNSLELNDYKTPNPSSNIYLYSPPNDRDSWIYLDSADTSSNWGIYHRQIDSTINDLPGNAIGFIGGGNNELKSYISLHSGDAYFKGNLGIGNTTPTSGKLQFANDLGNKIVVWDGGEADRYGIGLNSGNLNAFIPWFATFSIRNNRYDGTEKFAVTGEGHLLIKNTGEGFAKLTCQTFDNETDFETNNLKLNMGFELIYTSANIYPKPVPYPTYEFIIGHAAANSYANIPGGINKFIKKFSVNQYGDLAVTGSISGGQTKTGWALGQGAWPPDNWLRLTTENGGSTYHDLAVNSFLAAGAKRFDLAEVTPVRAEDMLEQGDVVVIDKENGLRVMRSTKPYDTSVYGIVSSYEQASIIIGGFGGPEAVMNEPDKLPVALIGRVKAKASSEAGAIQIGDLLTTSSTPGHLMKCDNISNCAGAIVGKALEPLESDNGTITILVALQ